MCLFQVFVCLLVYGAVGTSGAANEESASRGPRSTLDGGGGGGGGGYWVGTTQPYFAALPTNLTILSGNTARLTCRVHLLGDRAVTWMRLQDFHILTVGLVTYTADDRFQVTHTADTEDWNLHLHGATVADTGAYVCQVNARPRIARRVYLTVTDKAVLEGILTHPSANQGRLHTAIEGSPNRHIQTGSSLALTCSVTHPPPASPPTLLWYKGGVLLMPDGGRLSLQVEREGSHTTSRLLLRALTPADAGAYTCVPVGGAGVSVDVHVTQGKTE
ncbi:zwei Ig domain protein zig-8-like, partial [Portunus trituberculatus]|uniref:zwei Ig domain protein zig-8-like n=1 Tax=Portunus trituberculatus TaxID=210409 RepID=UPI001E1D05AA